MKIKIITLLLSLFVMTGCVTNAKKTEQTQAVAATGTGTLVIKPIKFKKDAYIREAVKKECNLDGKLQQFIEQNAAPQYATIITDNKSRPSSAQILTIEIEQVQGSGGGAWSGGKMVLVNGKLSKRGRVLGSFKARRFSGGGMFGAYKGTCAILGRCVKTLGKDIATWLANPTANAVLGDL
jgi:hypothetical protein